MKPRNLLTAAAIVLVGALAWGCGEDPTCADCCDDCWRPYLPQTSPENVVANLASSYERREIEQYAVLLDPAFIFKFQEGDIPAGLERDYWNRDEDSTGTEALFNATTEVSKISLDLGAFTSEDANRLDMPGAKRIRLTHARLEVELFNGVTLLVHGDIQDMYFGRGRVEAGTDSTKWYLVEWQDLSGGGGSPGWRAARGADAITPAAPAPLVEPTTWGRIKANF